MLLDALLWLDRAVNVLIGGSFRETLSARAHRMDVKDHPYWGWTASFINALFFWQEDHCRKQWEYEQAHPLTGEMMPRDKLLHFGAGLSIALVVGFVLSPWHGLLVAVIAGALKELTDHFHPLGHTVDLWDFLATASGGLLATMLLLGGHQWIS